MGGPSARESAAVDEPAERLRDAVPRRLGLAVVARQEQTFGQIVQNLDREGVGRFERDCLPRCHVSLVATTVHATLIPIFRGRNRPAGESILEREDERHER
jgi:hypothetical protein